MILHEPHRLRRARRIDPETGFTLAELLVGLAVTSLVLMGLYQVFESNSDLARTQTDIADMQQSLRIAQNEMIRMIRMAGRGGLPEVAIRNNNRLLPAIFVRDDAGNGGDPAEIAPGLANSPKLIPGTDVLIIRGVFTSPLYQINNADPTTFLLFDTTGQPTTDLSAARTGQITVMNPAPTGIPQDLTALFEADQNGSPEALVIVSPIDERIFAVVEFDPRNSTVSDPTAPTGQATIAFNVTPSDNAFDGYRDLYDSGIGLNPRLPNGLTSTAQVGILEEYRYYIRDAEPSPRLSMARMYPNTEEAHLDDLDNTRLDIADNIINFQVALGFDSALGDPLVDRNGDTLVDENDIVITEADDGENDDWVFNTAPGRDDRFDQAPWMPPWDDDPNTGTPPQPELYYVRISTLARVQVPDRTFQAPILAEIENADVDSFNTAAERQYRRALLQTTIDLRNL